MNERKKYVPLFPKQFDFLNAKFQVFEEGIVAIDREVEEGKKDKGPVLTNLPIGRGHTNNPEMRRRRINYLGATRDIRVKEFRKGISQELQSLDTKSQRTILDRYDFQISKNGFKDYSKQDLKTVKNIDKQDKASFDYMAARYFNKYQVMEIEKAGEKENIDQWSDRYMKLLDDYRSPASEIDLNKDGPEPEKE